MDLTQLIEHPELMDKETLYDLRSLLALHPYYQTAHLLMLKNLYLLHDPSFDDELRRAALYITDRKEIFNLVEAAHYKLRTADQETATEPVPDSSSDRTVSLIDSFLDTIPDTEEPPVERKRRKPTPADATVDYVSYLLESENEQQEDKTPQMKGQSYIDDFINNEGGRIELGDAPAEAPQAEETQEVDSADSEGYFTETLARIYIKQGRYSKALEIIKRLNLNYPKKNAYFADQIRFLEKLIINNTYKND